MEKNNKEITPIFIRDQIVECFTTAHSEALEEMIRGSDDENRQEVEDIKKINILYFIKSKFEEVGADFTNPTRKDLIAVLDKLVKFSLNFRAPDIVKGNYSKMMALVEKLPSPEAK